MTHTDQHTQAPGAPPGRRSRTRSASLRTVLRSAGAIVTVAGAAMLGVLALAVDDQNQATGRPLATEQASSRATQASVPDPGPAASPTASWPTTGKTPTCSIWSVPTLEVAPVPQSNLTEGVPYVAVCTDDSDEETTFVFLYGHDNHTPAPRR